MLTGTHPHGPLTCDRPAPAPRPDTGRTPVGVSDA
jgi:hypothetical protein